MIRLIVCVDLGSDNLADAYAQLSNELRKTELAWETSDEAYQSDGVAIPPDELQRAILSVLNKTIGRWSVTDE